MKINRENGTEIGPEQSTRNLDPHTSAIIISSKTVGNVTFNVSSVIVYTDYVNIQLRFACGVMPSSSTPYTYYFILVRSRAFNSLPLLMKALEKVKKLQGQETFVFLHNDAAQNCIN
jgi:hypothetical protein